MLALLLHLAVFPSLQPSSPVVIQARQGSHMTVASFDRRLHTVKSGMDDTIFAEDVRGWLGKNIKVGAIKTDETDVAFAIETDVVPVLTTYGLGRKTETINLTRIESTNIYGAVVHFESGAGFHYKFNDNPEGFIDVYKTPDEDKVNANVPHGELKRMPDWVSTIYPGRSFEWYVYTPAGLAPGEEAALMVFQDGAGAKGYMPAVLDNLIAKGEIPKMVGVFVNPGFFIDSKKSDRSFEYDTLSDQYSQFLLQEILPEVEKTTPLKKDPAFRAIAGASSGGICAFTAAWEHPEQFGKVMSWIGSFTDIAHGKSLKEGGQNYPSMIRLTPKKPIRVFLQDGINDLDNQFGNWPLANEGMAKALAFAGYDYKFVLGNGNHSGRHGVAILPDTLRWLWRPN